MATQITTAVATALDTAATAAVDDAFATALGSAAVVEIRTGAAPKKSARSSLLPTPKTSARLSQMAGQQVAGLAGCSPARLPHATRAEPAPTPAARAGPDRHVARFAHCAVVL